MIGLLLPDSTLYQFVTVGCVLLEKTVWTRKVEVCFCSNVVSRHSESRACLCGSVHWGSFSSFSIHLCLFPPLPASFYSFFSLQTLMPVEDASPCATLPRSHLVQVGPVPERCHSLSDLSRSPALGRRTASYTKSSSADVSPLRRVLTRRMNMCPNHKQKQQPLRTPACAVVLEQPVCSPYSLWHFVSK